MNVIQWIAILFAVLFFTQVLVLTSKRKLQDQQAFFWITVSFGSVLVSIFIPMLNEWAAKIGIAYMPTIIFMVAFLVILNLLIYQTIMISKQQETLKNVVQELAFVKKQLDDIKKVKDDFPL